MKAVIDEGVPRRSAHALSAHGIDVSTFPETWRGLRNGQLLARAARENFTCLLTCDKNFPHQQSVRNWPLALVVLPRQRFADLEPGLAAIAAAVSTTLLGHVAVMTFPPASLGFE